MDLQPRRVVPRFCDNVMEEYVGYTSYIPDVSDIYDARMAPPGGIRGVSGGVGAFGLHSKPRARACVYCTQSTARRAAGL